MVNDTLLATGDLSAAQTTAYQDTEFDSLLDKAFRPKTPQAAKAVEAAVQTLAQQALTNTVTVSDDAYKSIATIIEQIDRNENRVAPPLARPAYRPAPAAKPATRKQDEEDFSDLPPIQQKGKEFL